MSEKDFVKTIETIKKTLEKARDEVLHVEGMIERVEARRDKLTSELAELEKKRGDVVMVAMEEGADEEVIKRESRKITVKRDELETSKDVIKALQERLVRGERAVIEVRAACFQAEADYADNQAELRQPKLDKMLADLEAFEGVKYAPERGKQSGPVLGSEIVGGAPGIIFAPVGLTQQLRQKAAYYRQCAACEVSGQPYEKSIWDGKPLHEIPDYLAGGCD